MRTLFVLVLFLVVCVPVLADGFEAYDFVLLPVLSERVNGAYGSVWETTLAIANQSETRVSVQGLPASCPVPCGLLPPIAPHASLNPPSAWSGRVPSNSPGALIYVEKGRVPDLSFTLRTRDLSRGGENWGVAIPVISRERVFTRPFGIADIPVTPDYRSLLRIYDFDAKTPSTIMLRVYASRPHAEYGAPADELLFEQEVQFTPVGHNGFPQFGFAQVALSADPRVAARTNVRVELAATSGAMEHWAFVSATHNQTQFVTIVTPQ